MNFKDVTIIIPVYNEEKHIEKVVNSIINQDWNGQIQLIVVDNMSDDNTVNILKEINFGFKNNIKLEIIKNSIKNIAKSLNLACNNAKFEVILRLDGHTYAPKNYIKECVNIVKKYDCKCIAGGQCNINPSESSIVAKSIAYVVQNKFGVGNVAYRSKNNISKEVDTVPFGAYTLSLWKKLHGYDEDILFDEDYDFELRARCLGYKIVLNPEITLQYYARSNIKSLAKQYFRYGYWSFVTIIKNKRKIKLRKLIPLFFVLYAISLFFIRNIFYLIPIAIYLILLFVCSIKQDTDSIKEKAILIIVFPIVHISYGIGSLISLVKNAFSSITNKNQIGGIEND